MYLETIGWRILERKAERYGVEIDIIAVDRSNAEVWIECKGGYGSRRDGARRTDSLLKFLGGYQVIEWESGGEHPPYILLTSALPRSGRAASWITIAQSHGVLVYELPLFPDVGTDNEAA